MQGVEAFDALLDIVNGYSDEVGGKVDVEDGDANIWVKNGGY